VKIYRHGQAAILSHPEIELLFAEGLQSDRERALFGVCLYTAARIAEACSMCLRMSTLQAVESELL
jgi:integrase/recombinase XerD